MAAGCGGGHSVCAWHGSWSEGFGFGLGEGRMGKGDGEERPGRLGRTTRVCEVFGFLRGEEVGAGGSQRYVELRWRVQVGFGPGSTSEARRRERLAGLEMERGVVAFDTRGLGWGIRM